MKIDLPYRVVSKVKGRGQEEERFKNKRQAEKDLRELKEINAGRVGFSASIKKAKQEKRKPKKKKGNSFSRMGGGDFVLRF